MISLQRLIAPALLCALATVSASASNVYVSQSVGKDTNDGLSPRTPLQTLAKAGSVKGLKGGDAILLMRGDVWHEQLVIPASGTSARSRFTVDAYGKGAAPVIDGADVVTGWSLISSGTYQVRRTNPAYKVFVDALYTPSVPLTLTADLQTTINQPGSFYADADSLYVHLADSSNPSGHTIEVSGSDRPTGIVASNKSYVTVQNIQVMRTTNSGVAFVLDYANLNGASGNQYNIIHGMTIFNTGSSARMPFGFDGGIMVRANTSGGSLALRGWEITNNQIGRLDSAHGLNYNIGGIQLRGVNGALIRSNVVQTTNAMGIQDRPYGVASSCGGSLIQHNTLTDNEGNISAECANEIVVRNNITNSRGFGIQVQSYGYVATNVIAHLDVSRDGTLYNGIDGNGGDHARYVNNTVRDAYACSITIEGAANEVSVEGGTYDSNNASGCATYTTASAGPVKFKGRINWVVNPQVPKPFGYRLVNTSDRKNRHSLKEFLAITK